MHFEVSFKALYFKLSTSCVPEMTILGQVKGLKEKIKLAIEKKGLIEDLLSNEIDDRLSMEIDGIECDLANGEMRYCAEN